MASQTLILTRRDVARLLTLDECIAAVEAAFRAHGEGRAPPPGVLGLHTGEGGFHIKAALLDLDRRYFAAKINGNYPENRERHGLPTIQGVIALCDAENGTPLALLDSIEITTLRTGAATAVAARYLAREDARVVVVCGCGNQGRIQLRALSRVRLLTKAYAHDVDSEVARRYAGEMAPELGIDIETAPTISAVPAAPLVWLTSTTSRRAFLTRAHVAPGSFVAAVGADNEEKQEIAPELMAASKVVVDVLDQCARIGDLHYALAAGAMAREDVHGELGAVVAGLVAGRESDGETIIFDSTGTALQDVAAAAVVYRKALATGMGLEVELNK